MNLGFDTFDTFRFKQLIFVNSAAYAYTQIRIDQHTALFGENNLGKTSMLNALKLFLLPEVNFRKCASKFNFRGTSGKVYDGLASFRYYFPEDRTFIILEAENPHNDFCIVLHRGSATDQLEYARMVVPRPYADIQHLFWDLDATADDGIGAPIESMTLKGTKSALRELGGEPLSDGKTLQERLFTNQPYDKKAGRYSLLPLRNGAGKREMDAWRKLVHLAFDISAQDERTLPDTLATIIEGQKSRKQEELNIDLNAIVDEANLLREEGDRITRIRNASDHWADFNSRFMHEQQLREHAAQAYTDLDDSVAVEEVRLLEAQETAASVLQEAQGRAETLQHAKGDSEKAVMRVAADVEATQKQVDELRKQINTAHATLKAYPGMPRSEVINLLDEYIIELVETMAGYENKAVAQERLSQINRRLEENKRQALQLDKQLSRRAPTLLDDLPVRDASILYSINTVLGTTYGELSTEQQQAFIQFSHQFHSEDGHLMLGQPQQRITLKGIAYQAYDAEKTRESIQNQLHDLQDGIARDEKRRATYMEEATLSAEEIDKRSKLTEQQKRKSERDKNALNALDASQDSLESLQADMQGLEDKQEELNAQLETVEADWQEAETQRKAAHQNQQQLHELAQQTRLIRQRLDRIGKDANNVLERRHQHLAPTPCAVTEATMGALEDDIDKLSALRNEVHDHLRKLLAINILPNMDSQAYISAFSGEQVAGFHEQLKAIYDNLDTQEANYRNKVERHNKTTHTQVEILRTAKEQVTAFMSRINAEMGQFSISDLEAVRVEYQLHPRFQQLLANLDQADLLSDELQDGRVYSQLKDFQADFFNRDARRTGLLLSLDKILERVTYSYRKRGEDEWTTNAQSNGTTMMITTNLLSVLMSRLMDGEAQVTMPLVMDEFGSLATRNMRTARKMAEQHGYCLFVANPNRDSKITQVLEHYVHLGLFHASRAYAENRTVVHHGLCESLTRQGKITPRETGTNEAAIQPSREASDQ